MRDFCQAAIAEDGQATDLADSFTGGGKVPFFMSA